MSWGDEPWPTRELWKLAGVSLLVGMIIGLPFVLLGVLG